MAFPTRLDEAYPERGLGKIATDFIEQWNLLARTFSHLTKDQPQPYRMTGERIVSHTGINQRHKAEFALASAVRNRLVHGQWQTSMTKNATVWLRAILKGIQTEGNDKARAALAAAMEEIDQAGSETSRRYS
jgi:hypothetical protein